jgi:hypothetical protein
MDELIIPRIDDYTALTDADAQRVRTLVLDKLAADSARYLSEYSERFDNVLNADDAATLFDEYNGDRARYRVAVHPAATWVRDELFRRALAEVPVEDTGRVVFTAGSNGAGKSSAIAYSEARQWAHVVLDSTLATRRTRDVLSMPFLAHDGQSPCYTSAVHWKKLSCLWWIDPGKKVGSSELGR